MFFRLLLSLNLSKEPALITLTRQWAQRQHDLIRRCLGRRFCLPDLPVLLQSGADGFRLRAWSHQDAIEFHAPGAFADDQIVVPWEALKACAGSRAESVTVERTDQDQTIFRWSDRGIPQVAAFQIPEVQGSAPGCPTQTQKPGEGFLAALRAALETVETDTIRYATDCVRLRGEQGTLAVTDTRQALVVSGFHFPFEGEVLVRPNPVFKSAVFADDADVEIGFSENWLTIRIGAWTIHSLLEKDRRFPDVEGCIPAASTVKARLCLSETDACFLERSLSRLPADATFNGLVTVDLNGAIAIRSKSPECPLPTELVLRSSSRTGNDICLSTHRRYLERAVRLGFRELGFVSPEAPAVCSDARRTYFWAVLGQEGIVKPNSNAVRVESPQAEDAVPPEKKPTENAGKSDRKANSLSRQQRPEPAVAKSAPETPSETDPIRQALLARDTLRSALRQNRQLLAVLRQQRKGASSRQISGGQAIRSLKLSRPFASDFLRTREVYRMPLTINVGCSQKLGRPDYGSIGASCHIECELDGPLPFDEPATLQTKVKALYQTCSQAVHDELARHRSEEHAASSAGAPSSATVNGSRKKSPDGRPTAEPKSAIRSNGAVNHQASQRQMDYLQQLARQIDGLGTRGSKLLASRICGKELARFSSFDASRLIDTLKAMKDGRLDPEAAPKGGGG